MRDINKSPDSGALRSDMGPGVSPQDPTALTTQQLLREGFWSRELYEAQLAALILRIDAADKAVKLLQAFADRTPTTMDVQHEVTALREVVMEMFKGIRTQLAERDVQTEKASRDVKSAVDAAFAAAKEAVGEQNKSNALAIAKSETSFIKQIDMFGETNKTNMKAVDDKISDIKERITIIESKTSISDPSTAVNIAKLDAAVSRLTSTTDISGGSAAGKAALWALFVGGLGLLFGAATFIGYMMKLVK